MPTLLENIASFFNIALPQDKPTEEAPNDLQDTLTACIYAMMSFSRVLCYPFENILSEEIHTIIKKLHFGNNIDGEELSREINAVADKLTPDDDEDWADLSAEKEEERAAVYFNNSGVKDNFKKLITLSEYIEPKKQYGEFLNGVLEEKGSDEVSMILYFLQAVNPLYGIFQKDKDITFRFGDKLNTASINIIKRIIENLADFQKELIRKYGLSRSAFFSTERAASFYAVKSYKNESSLLKQLAKAERDFIAWPPYFIFEAIAARRAGQFSAAGNYLDQYEKAKSAALEINFYNAAAAREKILIAQDSSDAERLLLEIENNSGKGDGSNLLFCALLHYLMGNTEKGDEIIYSEKPLPHILKNTLKEVFGGKERHITPYEAMKKKAESGDTLSCYQTGKILLFTGQTEGALSFLQQAKQEGQSAAFVQVIQKIRGEKEDGITVGEFLRKGKEDIEACYVLWLLLYHNVLEENDCTEAEAILREYAGNNDPISQALLASYLIKQKKFKEAIEWAERSAKTGSYVGQYIAAELFTKARETKQSREKAEHYYMIAAQSGFPHILHSCATYILSGKPNKYKRDYAEDLLNEAVRLGYSKAKAELMKLCLGNEAMSENKEQGAKLAFELAEQGDAEAIYYAALCHRDGIGTEKDETRAAELFRKGSELGERHCLFLSAKKLWEESSNEEGKDKARAMITSLSKQGLPAAQAFLGEKYLFEENSVQHTSQGIELLNKAISKGDRDAELTLAFCYMSGRGVTTDQSHSIELIKRAAKHGNQEAQFYLDSIINCDLSKFKQRYEAIPVANNLSSEFCNMLSDEGYKKKTPEELKKMSDLGDTRALLELGMRDLDAFGAVQGKTARIIEAAEKGNAYAQYLSGNIYSAGIGVIADQEKALAFYRKSAEQGLADAECVLGSCFLQGQGVKEDPEEAMEWFKKAASKGLASAQIALAGMNFHGIGVEKDSVTAAYWYREAAKKEVTEGEGNLGICYVQGEGVPRNETIGAKWLYKAAVKGFAPAQASLGLLFLNGIGIPKNENVAVELLQIASDQNDPTAQFYLGACYSRGISVRANQTTAISWCLKSAENGFPMAQYQMGYYYENAGFLARNLNKAIFWYSRAALQGVKEAEEHLKAMGIDIEQFKNAGN